MKKTTKNEILEAETNPEIAEILEIAETAETPEVTEAVAEKPVKKKAAPKKTTAKKATAKKAPAKTEEAEPVAEETEPIVEEAIVEDAEPLEVGEVAEKAEAQEKPKRKRTPKANRLPSVQDVPVVSVDRNRTVKTDGDETQDELFDIVASMKSHKILTDTIIGIENVGSQKVAVLYHGSFKIIIPAQFLVYNMSVPQDSPRYDEALAHYAIKHLGAEVDYVVEKFDAKENIAIANRVTAMKLRRKQYYLGFDRQGNKIVYPGAYCEGRVVSVLGNGIFVDLFGVETFIKLKELSYQRILSAKEEYKAGDKVLVKMLEVDTSNKNNIVVEASVKQAKADPTQKIIEKISVDNYYMGNVTLITNSGIFVILDIGVECLCKFPIYERPMRGARVSVRILGIDKDKNRVWGLISHISNVF